MDPGLVSCQGGLADNAIPRETVAQLIIPEEKQQEFMLAAETFSGIVQSELAARDPGFQFRVEMKGIGQDVCVAGADLKKAVALLLSLPNGVQAMSADMPGLVETSLNLGILTITAQSLQADYAVRSSIESRKEALLKTMEAVCYLAGASYSSRDSYPGWAYRVNSPLRDKMIAVYEEMYGEKPKVDAVHAGLECGLLASKIEDLDCVALGPNAHFIHTTEEYLSIVSVARVWEYLIRLLARKG